MYFRMENIIKLKSKTSAWIKNAKPSKRDQTRVIVMKKKRKGMEVME